MRIPCLAQRLDKQTLEKLYLVDKLSQKEIAIRYNSSPNAVSRLRERYGLETLNNSKILSQRLDKPTFERLYLVDRLTLREIAAKYNSDRRTVTSLRERYGTEIRAKDCKLLAQRLNVETLARLYNVDRLSQKEIAIRYNTSYSGIGRLMKKYNIKARNNVRNTLAKRLDKATLEKLYYVDRLLLREIASRYNSSNNSVTGLIKQYGIKIRPDIRNTLPSRLDKQTLERLYVEDRLTLKKIAIMYDSSESCVGRLMKQYNLKTRGNLPTPLAQRLDKETLENLYIQYGLLQREIASMYNCHQITVCRLLVKYGIPARGLDGRFCSDSTHKKMSESRMGPKNPMFGKKRPDLAALNKSRKGIPLTQGHKANISESLQGEKHPLYRVPLPEWQKDILRNRVGDLNPNWHNGVSFEPYNSLFNGNFKEAVKNKYGPLCLYCGKEEILSIHHINYIKAHSSFLNCVSVCNRCNVHFNKDRDYWFSYWCDFLGITPEDNIIEAEKLSKMNPHELELFRKSGYILQRTLDSFYPAKPKPLNS